MNVIRYRNDIPNTKFETLPYLMSIRLQCFQNDEYNCQIQDHYTFSSNANYPTFVYTLILCCTCADTLSEMRPADMV